MAMATGRSLTTLGLIETSPTSSTPFSPFFPNFHSKLQHRQKPPTNTNPVPTTHPPRSPFQITAVQPRHLHLTLCIAPHSLLHQACEFTIQPQNLASRINPTQSSITRLPQPSISRERETLTRLSLAFSPPPPFLPKTILTSSTTLASYATAAPAAR